VNHNSNNTIDIDTLYTVADQFIDLANTLSQEAYTPNTVGSAFRYAATRFSAFEASMVATDLARDKETIKAALLKDYEHMLEENLQVYIHHQQAGQNT